MAETVIDIAGLNYKVGNKYLLNNICWQVQKGQRWVVFGLNGSGKTTLLSIISGFSRYSSGQVRVFGKDCWKENLAGLRKRIGFVSSSFFDKYYHSEKALDIVLSGLNGTLGLSYQIKNADLLLAKKILESMQMWSKSHQPFDELSKGERQKILIARALISQPELLILDEPATGLDVVAREQLLDFVRRLSTKEMTIIYVSHYTEEILDVFEHCLFLKQGRIYQCGRVSEMFISENLSAFLGAAVWVEKVRDKYYISVEDDGCDFDA